ncbi:acyl-CoA dehydrogenase family protein [Streptomyces sp. MB22_4]|uniref:acyl-CoA dehydrogenase family protein n=1 Tax=Streptomyces sp. MB22_4 TaxID=3383120 RepID=UPI0039A0C7E7
MTWAIEHSTAEEDQALEFRNQLEDALAGFDAEDFERWEREGRTPRELPAALGRAGVFRQRWKNGAEQGLPRLVTMSQTLYRLSSGAAVVAMGQSEMFIGALRWLAETPYQLSLLEKALDGRTIGCFGATEPHGGSNLRGLRTTAYADPDGWRLRGCKRYISNVSQADYILVLARPENPAHVSDLSLFLVPLDHPGVSFDGVFDTVGLRSCDAGQVTFDVKLPPDALLGKAGIGLLYATHLLQFERLAICAQLAEAAEHALRLSVAYARRRTTGDSRIMDKQAIRHRLALCRAELWNVQGRLRELVAMAERDRRMPAHEISALKLTTGDITCRIVDTALQIFGARGYTQNFPVERLWRDVRLSRLGGGTDEVLADLVASGLDRRDPTTDSLLTDLEHLDVPRFVTDHAT